MADTAWISTLRSPKRNTRASNSLGREPAPLSERVKLKTVNSTKMDKVLLNRCLKPAIVSRH
eukprot:m.6120 g.6120  ORF g.6120 m.6120 type:complete len:62 (-) comp8234_c0_seq1:8-193(-)